MLRAFETGLDRGSYDAAFFKFCFVDFAVPDGEWETTLERLERVVVSAHAITASRNMKLILGNALPLPSPSDETRQLQAAFNAWLESFSAEHPDVRCFDLFHSLADEEGRLKPSLARGPTDPHPNDRAFHALDGLFFPQISAWLEEAQRVAQRP
jgi:hypothetical protein